MTRPRPYDDLSAEGKARRHRATARAALAQYGLQDATLSQLAIDTNFLFRVRVADGRRFALRVQRNGLHPPDGTELELWWVDQLAHDGLPVAAPVTNASGRHITTVEPTGAVPEPHRCVLFQWLPGSPPDEDSMQYWTAIGQLTARLHAHAAALELPARFSPQRWDSVFPYTEPILFDDRFARLISPAVSEMLAAGVRSLDPLLAARYDGGPSLHLVHGDLQDGNLRSFHGQLSVFDFEDLIVGLPDHDLAVLLYSAYYNRDDFDDVVGAVRLGYETVRPWPLADTADLFPLFAGRAMILVDFCLIMGPPYDRYIGMLSSRIQRWLET